MANRTQVALNLQQETVRPAAAPIDGYYTPTLPRPAMQNIIDLSPLSQALTEIKVDQMKAEGQTAAEAGKKAALDANQQLLDRIGAAGADLTDAEKRRQANQDAFSKEVAAGNIPESANPWFRASFMETSARRVMDAYQNDLQAQLGSVSTVVDPATGLPQAPTNPQQIIGETWKKYANNGVFSDFYGGKVSNAMRERIDSDFLQHASAAQAEAMNAARKDQLASEMGAQFTKWAVAPGAPSPEDYSAMEQFVTNEVKRMGVGDPRALVMKSVKFAAASSDTSDDGEGPQSEASRLLRYVRDLKVGPTSLGKDATAGTEIAALIKEYDALHERKQTDQYIKQQRDKKVALESSESDLLKVLQDERAKGLQGDVAGAGKRYIDSLLESQAYGPKNTPFAVQQATQTVASFLNEPFLEDKDLVNTLTTRIFAGYNLQTLPEDARAAVNAKQISGTTYGSLMQAFAQRTNLTPLLEANPAYSTALGDLEKAQKLEGFPPDVQAKYSEAAQQVVDDFRNAAASAAQSFAGTPTAMNSMRSALDPLFKDARKKLEDMTASVRTEHDQKLTAIFDAISHSVDATGLIQDAKRVFSSDEIVRLQDLSNKASDRERFYNIQPFREAEAMIQQRAAEIAAVELADKAKGGITQDLATAYSRQLKTRFDAWLSENAATTPPAQLNARAGGAIQEMVDELVGKMGGSNLDKVILGIQSGKTAQQTGEEIQKTAQDRNTYIKAASSDLPTAAATLTDTGRHPLVPNDVYELQKLFLSRESAGVFFGTQGFTGQVSRTAVENQADVYARDLMSKPGASESDKAAAVASIYRNVGIPAQGVLDGFLTVQPSAEWRARAQAALARMPESMTRFENLRNPKDTGQWATKAQIQAMVDEPPLKVPIKGSQLDAFNTPFFSSKDELKSWVEGKAGNVNALLQKLGVSPSGPEKTDWIKAQLIAIERTHPNG